MARSPVNDIDAIGTRLRVTREALGWTQVEMCRRTGIKEQAWNNYEQGRRRIAIDQAYKVVVATGVSLDWIYWGSTLTLPARIDRKLPVEFRAAG